LPISTPPSSTSYSSSSKDHFFHYFFSPTLKIYCNVFNIKLKILSGVYSMYGDFVRPVKDCERNRSINTILLQYCSNKFWLYGLQPAATYNVANFGVQNSLHPTETYVNTPTFTY
jgi:hypothetical protein